MNICIYMYTQNHTYCVYIYIYIDDILVTCDVLACMIYVHCHLSCMFMLICNTCLSLSFSMKTHLQSSSICRSAGHRSRCRINNGLWVKRTHSLQQWHLSDLSSKRWREERRAETNLKCPNCSAISDTIIVARTTTVQITTCNTH